MHLYKYKITRHIIGSDHVVVTTVRWTVVSESPSSYAAKACNTLVCGFLIRNATGSYFFAIKCFQNWFPYISVNLCATTIDTVIVFLYIYIHLFPDCVMVALQILVLTVGVRILLGELKLKRLGFSFFFGSFEHRLSSSPSQSGETGSTPVGAKTSFQNQFSSW